MASLFNKPALLQNFFLNKFNVRLHQVKAQTNSQENKNSNNNAEGDDNENDNDGPPPPAPASSQDDTPPPPLRKEMVDSQQQQQQNDSQVANNMSGGTGKKIVSSGFTEGNILLFCFIYIYSISETIIHFVLLFFLYILLILR